VGESQIVGITREKLPGVALSSPSPVIIQNVGSVKPKYWVSRSSICAAFHPLLVRKRSAPSVTKC